MRLPKTTRVEDMLVGPHQRLHFVTTILSLGMVPIEWVIAFGRLQMPVNAKAGSMIIKGYEVAAGRNKAAENVLSMDPRPQYLFFLGDDMLPPWDALVTLSEEMARGRWDVLTGLYYWKGEPPTPLTWRDDLVGPMRPGEHFTPGEVIQVDVTGMDCTLIRVDILDKIRQRFPPFKRAPVRGAGNGDGTPQGIGDRAWPEWFRSDRSPWFRTGPAAIGGQVVLFTEDVWFCDRVREVGGRVGVHTGVRVAHLDVHSGMVY